MAEIVYLADYPQFAPVVAGWVFEQWGRHRPGASLERVLNRVEGEKNIDHIPVCLLALEAGKPVGTAALRVRDMDTRPEMNPWLGSVYVVPERRRQGVGSALVAAVETEARRLGVRQLYLFTPDREKFYAWLGWKISERTIFRDQAVAIMTKRLV